MEGLLKDLGSTRGLGGEAGQEGGQEFDCEPGCPKRAHCRRINSSGKVKRELTGRESEPWEIIYCKPYKTQIPIIEQAIETVALMPGTNKSRGYCLEMICADFLAAASLEGAVLSIPRCKRPRLFRDREKTPVQVAVETYYLAWSS